MTLLNVVTLACLLLGAWSAPEKEKKLSAGPAASRLGNPADIVEPGWLLVPTGVSSLAFHLAADRILRLRHRLSTRLRSMLLDMELRLIYLLS